MLINNINYNLNMNESFRVIMDLLLILIRQITKLLKTE